MTGSRGTQTKFDCRIVESLCAKFGAFFQSVMIFSLNHLTILKSSCPHKPSKSSVVEPQQMLRKRKAEATEPLGDWPGEKRWQHKQPTGHILPWSTVQSITTTNPSSYVSYQISPKRQCRQCHSEFPHRKKVIPYDIVLSHEERWMYPIPQKTSEKLPCAILLCKKYLCCKSISLFRLVIFGDPN